MERTMNRARTSHRLRRCTVGLVACVMPLHHTLAQSHGVASHHELPTRVVVRQHAGAYVASVWSTHDVGMGAIYVVLDKLDDSPFVAPSAVRVAVAPASGRLPEVVHRARVYETQHPERYMTDVMFDRSDRWKIRVIVEGTAGRGELTTYLDTKPNAMHGVFGLVLSTLPFLLVAAVLRRVAVIRQRMIETGAIPARP